ncbi:TRAP transporter small permease [Kushneria phosphatilytica]|uniref:TRAP transporter small permease protein n=1 Tax=Kushneria phosphatilytica TaxID=657387 RepID=A0A1S1NRV8_9GAMM|nr:TRAP transporter small permease [Kushneria phosphatilytica]OHV07628.1 C4-dicarboxylate ABC transporter [Kushneria phosphatilytica]QEL10115.1 TRAP transporter small permease [Kushneria phosphatilytica]
MSIVMRVWNRLEEGLVALLLAAMTLVTFAYVAISNLYNVFYDLADAVPWLETPAFAVGDFLLDLTQSMTWNVAMTSALFAWLIFIGIAWSVRLGAHIGVDLVVRLFPPHLRRVFGVIACLIFMAYAVLMLTSSYQWVSSLMEGQVGVEDLDQFGIKEWHVAIVMPIGFALVIARLVEVLINILRGRQEGLDLSSETSDALKLSEDNEQSGEPRS